MSVSSIEQTFSTATQLSNHVQDALAILGVSWWVACTGIDVKSKTVSDDSGPQQSEDGELASGSRSAVLSDSQKASRW